MLCIITANLPSDRSLIFSAKTEMISLSNFCLCPGRWNQTRDCSSLSLNNRLQTVHLYKFNHQSLPMAILLTESQAAQARLPRTSHPLSNKQTSPFSSPPRTEKRELHPGHKTNKFDCLNASTFERPLQHQLPYGNSISTRLPQLVLSAGSLRHQ